MRQAVASDRVLVATGGGRLPGKDEAKIFVDLLIDSDSGNVLDCEIYPAPSSLLQGLLGDLLVRRHFGDLDAAARRFEEQCAGPWRPRIGGDPQRRKGGRRFRSKHDHQRQPAIAYPTAAERSPGSQLATPGRQA